MAKQSSTVLVAIGVVFLVHFAAIPSVDGSRRINSPAEPSISLVPACGNGDGGSCSVSCESPLKDCDFYFHGHENEVPKIKLIKKGDNNIYVHCGHIVHKTGSQVLKVQTVNSAHCELLKGGSWNKHACHHRLYGNGRHIASREFNIGNPGDFLNNCIKVQISAAQYEGGANFNNGHNNPRACILVKTEGSFEEACAGSNCNSPPSPPPPSCTGSDCNPPPSPPCQGSDCKPPPSPPPSSCNGSDCAPPSPPSSCNGSDCAPPSLQPPCDGNDCDEPPSPPSSCNGDDCKKPPSPPPCVGSECGGSSVPPPPPCQGKDCKPPSPPSCSGSDCTAPPPPCDEGDDCKPPSKPSEPSTPSEPSDCGNGGGNCQVSCDKPLKDCDFYFHGHENDVPKVTLIKKGDNNIYVECGHILHRDGYDTRPVQTVNSAHCELLKGGSWNKHACHHRLYGNGKYVASREFNVGKPTDFLNTCIKVQISAAQYRDGGNFNNAHSNPRACILVKTEGSFK